MPVQTYDPYAPLQHDLEVGFDPHIVVEYKRYDQDEKTNTPDGWVFYSLVPDANGSEMPFDDGLSLIVDEGLTFRGRVDGWMQRQYAEHYRSILEVTFDKKLTLSEVPERFRGYVQNCVLPLEWQSDEAVMAERTTVWLSGEWPTV